jgi:hypothetical protein
MMKRALVRCLLAAIAVAYPSISFTSSKPTKDSAPLSADEIASYQAILSKHTAKHATPLNVANTTVPFVADTSTSGCLKGITLDDLLAASHSFNQLTEEVVSRINAKLVNPKKHSKIARANDPSRTIREGKPVEDAVRDAFVTGLFSMSEIAFDKEHRYAVVSYSFWCGRLCGQGATVVVERINGVWREANRDCGNWISPS